ncbi:MAG: tetratricopeptide repeat protein, partial [Bacteroidota bacterium]|nr:tetratricopeptide repeat protein [Bacteroidota bacterium]
MKVKHDFADPQEIYKTIKTLFDKLEESLILKVLNKLNIKGDKNTVLQNVNAGGNITINQFADLKNELFKGYKNADTHHNFPHAPETFFGRTKKLKQLHKKITENNTLLLVNGVAGIGKTTIAQKYVNMPEYATKYNKVFWFTVISNIKDDYIREIQEALKLNPENFQNKTKEESLNKIKNSLDNQTGNNLLVIDNANKSKELTEIKHFLPARNWKTLITSRAEPNNMPKLKIDELSPEDAKKLFYKFYSSNPEASARLSSITDKLLKYINYHTLLTELLAKAGKKKRLSVEQIYEIIISADGYKHKDLQRKIDIGLHANLSNTQKTDKIANYINTLYKTEDLNETQKKYLKYFAVLPNKEIFIDELLEIFAIKEEEQNDFEDIIEELHQNGWLLKSDDYYKIHQLIQTIITENLKPNIKNYLPLIINLKNILNTDAYGNMLEKTKYLPYAESLITRSFADISRSLTKSEALTKSKKELVTLINNSALIFKSLGNYKKSLEFHKKAIKIIEQVYDKNHPNLATSYNNVAITYEAIGEIYKELEYYKKAIEIREQVLPKNHLDLAQSYNNVAVTYRDLGETPKALEYNEKAITIREKVLL